PQAPHQHAAALPVGDRPHAGHPGARPGARAGARRHWTAGHRAPGQDHVRMTVAAQPITEPMAQYMAARPTLKYVFFGGKGGVGKTAMAGATAVWAADAGKRTLLASTNPVHSLSGLLDQDVFGRHTQVRGVNNLFAYEIDTKDTIERSKREIRDKIQWFLKFAEISTRADEFVESSTMNPAFDESAMSG